MEDRDVRLAVDLQLQIFLLLSDHVEGGARANKLVLRLQRQMETNIGIDLALGVLLIKLRVFRALNLFKGKELEGLYLVSRLERQGCPL